MKALLQKDLYVLWKQMRFLFIMMLILMIANGSFGSIFLIVWCSMLPSTAMAYDERSKWDQLAAMMPYSAIDLVFSKYLLGWLMSLGACLLAVVSQTVIRVLALPLETGVPLDVLVGFFGSMCVLSITLPLMFRFGTERGRMGMFVMIALVCGGTWTLSYFTASGGMTAVTGAVRTLALTLSAALAAVLTGISVPISVRLYRRGR